MSNNPNFANNRRRLLTAGGAVLSSTLLSRARPALAQDGARRYAGSNINVACWTAPYAKWLGEYVPDFEASTGIKVNYETSAAPIYNQRADLELSTKGGAYDVMNITFIGSLSLRRHARRNAAIFCRGP